MSFFAEIDGEEMLVWTEKHDHGSCAYIEPCGQFPMGFYFRARDVRRLADEGVIAPHYYDDERHALVKYEGVAFDICAESESEEADEIENRLRIRHGGHE